MFSKSWFRVGSTALLSLALSTSIAVAQGNGHGHDKHDRDDDDRWHDHNDRDHGNAHNHGRDHERYADRDGDIRGWYHTHYRHLPPGLAKHDRLPPGLERQLVVRGTLPPGLRTRMQPCPHELGSCFLRRPRTTSTFLSAVTSSSTIARTSKSPTSSTSKLISPSGCPTLVSHILRDRVGTVT